MDCPKGTHGRVQTLSTRSLYIDYFAIDSPADDERLALSAAAQPEATPSGAMDIIEAEEQRPEQIANADHAQVFTPWLTETRFRDGHGLPALSAKAAPAQPWEPSLSSPPRWSATLAVSTIARMPAAPCSGPPPSRIDELRAQHRDELDALACCITLVTHDIDPCPSPFTAGSCRVLPKLYDSSASAAAHCYDLRVTC